MSVNSESSTQRTVLIADDSQTERVKLRQTLEQAGYKVIEVQSGNEAKLAAVEHHPDLIMLDIIMDNGDGYQACRAIKRNTATQHIPVLMVSGKNNPVDKLWAEKQGASGYITKPYEAQDILSGIAALTLP
ncbi:response regulator [Thiofilum flexile]|uniref:response regulator n=1 Tax=Thiofilum flexile TaxID=125627 RepID=UPI00036C928A|nr:response regulator [Thiofilum flexile]